MDASIVNASLTEIFRELRERIEEAAAIATAAQAYASAGRADKGVETASDIDDLIYDAEKLIGAGTTIVRLRKNQVVAAPDVHSPSLPEPAMSPIDPTLAAATLKAFLGQARERLDRALGIARAAEICGGIGQADEAVRISLDIEPLLYEIRNFVNTASMVNRLADS
jgi:hypothetical protein